MCVCVSSRCEGCLRLIPGRAQGPHGVLHVNGERWQTWHPWSRPFRRPRATARWQRPQRRQHRQHRQRQQRPCVSRSGRQPALRTMPCAVDGSTRFWVRCICERRAPCDPWTRGVAFWSLGGCFKRWRLPRRVMLWARWRHVGSVTAGTTAMENQPRGSSRRNRPTQRRSLLVLSFRRPQSRMAESML